MQVLLGDEASTPHPDTSVERGTSGFGCSKCSKLTEQLQLLERHLGSGRIDKAQKLLRELLAATGVQSDDGKVSS